MAILPQKLNSVSICLASCSVGTAGVSLGVNGPGHEADHSHKVSRLKMDGAIPPFLIYAMRRLPVRDVSE